MSALLRCAGLAKSDLRFVRLCRGPSSPVSRAAATEGGEREAVAWHVVFGLSMPFKWIAGPIPGPEFPAGNAAGDHPRLDQRGNFAGNRGAT
jgi:hypothetical protein